MSYILGFTILYLIPAGFAYLFWAAVARLAAHWTGRDVMLRFIPDPHHVHHTERITGVVNLR